MRPGSRGAVPLSAPGTGSQGLCRVSAGRVAQPVFRQGHLLPRSSWLPSVLCHRDVEAGRGKAVGAEGLGTWRQESWIQGALEPWLPKRVLAPSPAGGSCWGFLNVKENTSNTVHLHWSGLVAAGPWGCSLRFLGVMQLRGRPGKPGGRRQHPAALSPEGGGWRLVGGAMGRRAP